MRVLAALILTTLTATPALAADAPPKTMTIGGQELKLNGHGIRKRFVIKVYQGALYLPAPSQNADEIVALDAPKAVRMAFLRGVSRDQVMGAFRDGFAANSGADAKEKFGKKLDRIATAIPDELKEGQVLTIAYVPNEGSVVSVGEKQVIVEGKDFSDALFRNWLGAKPADDDLKRKMLGR